MTKHHAAVLLATAIILSAAYAAVTARDQQPDASTLAGLVGEVRLLRQAVEKAAQTQTQVQALSVYLSAQQNRLIQVSAAADAARRHLEATEREHAENMEMVSSMTAAANNPSATPEQRREATSEAQALQRRETRLATDEARARAAVTDAESVVQLELNRWNEILARLDQATRQQ